MGKLEEAPPADASISQEPSATSDKPLDPPKAVENSASAGCDLPVQEGITQELTATQHGEDGTHDQVVTARRRTHGRALPR
jgi:hypothetical protein